MQKITRMINYISSRFAKYMMRSRLLYLSNSAQQILIVGSTIVLAFFIAMVFKLFFDPTKLSINTDLIASVYQVLGTIYAILLTFTLWGVWQQFTRADSSVQEEAYTILDLVHILEIEASWKSIAIRQTALNYLNMVLKKEWPKLKSMNSEELKADEATHCSSIELVKVVQSIVPNDERETVLFSKTLTLLSKWLDARRTRMLISRGNSAKALWPLLITGAFVLFAFHGLFVTQTDGIWITLLLGFSLVIGLTFYLIFTLDCPFSGFPSVDATPFELAINILKGPPQNASCFSESFCY